MIEKHKVTEYSHTLTNKSLYIVGKTIDATENECKIEP